jgi:hypothetical protein
MTSMYIDLSLESTVKPICLDDFFDGEIRKVNKGELIGKNKRISESYIWQLITKEHSYIDTNDILRDFYNQFLKNSEGVLNEIRTSKVAGCLYVVIKRNSEQDEFSITVDSEVLHFLCELNVEFAIDGIYQ